MGKELINDFTFDSLVLEYPPVLGSIFYFDLTKKASKRDKNKPFFILNLTKLVSEISIECKVDGTTPNELIKAFKALKKELPFVSDLTNFERFYLVTLADNLIFLLKRARKILVDYNDTIQYLRNTMLFDKIECEERNVN